MNTKFNSFFPAWLMMATLWLSGEASILNAADGSPVWTNVFNGLGNTTNYAEAMAVDGNGNVFVTGKSWNGTSSDYATIKYSIAGVPVWTNLFNGAGNGSDESQALAVDGSDNVFVTGKSWSGTSHDYATIKYSNAGVPAWTNVFGGAPTYPDEARALAVDGTGNVFVTGYSDNASSRVYATIKYSNAGVPVWTNVFDGAPAYPDEARALAVDGTGNVIVTGKSFYNSLSYDYATVKYSNAGVPVWTNVFNGPAGNGDDYPQALAVDGGGNVFVTGYSYHTVFYYDYATIKYSNAGVPVWTNVFNGANASDYAQALAVDGDGNVIVTGSSSGFNNLDYTTVKYSNAGVPVWTNTFNSLPYADDHARALAVDGSGNAFVTGYSYNADLYNYASTTIKYSNAGVPVWTNVFNGSPYVSDFAQALAVDGTGNVFVTGYSGNGTSWGYTTIFYSGPSNAPAITAQPASQMVVPTSNATFSVTASGVAPLVYKWMFNGAGIGSATNSTVIIANVASANQGGYSVVITNAYGSVTSSVAYLTLLPGYNSLSGARLSNGAVRLTYIGDTGAVFALDRSFNLAPPAWAPQATGTVQFDGTLIFTNTPDPATNNFWRVRTPP